MNKEERFFAAAAARNIVRPSVRALIHNKNGFLVQRPTDDPRACFAFIGGEYEVGDSFERRIRQEIEEESSARVIRVEYRFVVENAFFSGSNRIQTLEHYLEVEIDRDEVVSREPHLEQHWLSEEQFARADVRPVVVRDALLTPSWRKLRHLTVAL